MNPSAGNARGRHGPGPLATLLLMLVLVLATATATAASARAETGAPSRIRSVSTQYIAALGPPGARSGGGAQAWGLWPLDPGPRGVELSGFERLQAAGGIASEGWKFDAADWWLEEHGLIMESPQFPLPARRYRVTGARGVSAVLTIHPPDQRGEQRWELDGGATLHDVTHLACRSARYRSAAASPACSPANARQAAFPVAPGAEMPAVPGCAKQDYSVLIVTGIGPID